MNMYAGSMIEIAFETTNNHVLFFLEWKLSQNSEKLVKNIRKIALFSQKRVENWLNLREKLKFICFLNPQKIPPKKWHKIPDILGQKLFNFGLFPDIYFWIFKIKQQKQGKISGLSLIFLINLKEFEARSKHFGFSPIFSNGT